MTERWAWPRLSAARSVALDDARSGRTLHEARLAGRTAEASATTPSWAPAVPPARVGEVQAALRLAADERGWPAPLPGADAGRLDRAWADVLVETMAPTRLDAADPGVWRFVAVVVVPDLTRWRAPGTSADAARRAVDHVLGRLWWWCTVLGRDLLHDGGAGPLDDAELTELFRRRDVVADPRLARAVARRVLAHGPPGPARLRFTKALLLRVLRASPVVCLDALDDAALDELLVSLGPPG